MHPDRIDLLANGLIRFSQVEALNDPNEGWIDIDDEFAKDYLDENVFPELDARSDDEVLEYSFMEEYSRKDPYYKVRISPQQHVSWQRSLLKQHEFANIIQTVRRHTREDIDGHKQRLSNAFYEIHNKDFGILSLSEDPDIELLWSHYADGHRGFVLGLDVESSFFHDPNWNSGTPQIQKVHYQIEKPHLTILEKDDSVRKDQLLFFTKSAKWAYEREWRALRRLKAANKVYDLGGPKIFLFTLDPSTIQSVILGSRINVNLEKQVIQILKDSSEFEHVRLSKAHFDGYTIKLNDL